MSDLRDLMPTPETIQEIVEELRHGALRIGVFGEFSSGKSTFLNALMGEDLLSVAVEPTTATATRIRWSLDFNILVFGPASSSGQAAELARFFSGEIPAWARFVGRGGVLSVLLREQKKIRDFLARWTREDREAAQAGAVELHIPQPFLKKRLCLVDTPGSNNEFARHHRIIEQQAAQVDIAVCLLDARQGGKKTELDFVATVAATAPKTVLVASKIDCVDEEEREEVAEGLREALVPRWPQGKGTCPPVWTCSALACLDEKMRSRYPDLATGFDDLRNRLMAVATQERGRLILARLGGLDRTLKTLAGEAETSRQFDVANRALEECLSLYQEAGIDEPELATRAANIENELQRNLVQINEAHALLQKAEQLLKAHGGISTAEIRDLALKATLIFKKVNQRDERLDRLWDSIQQPLKTPIGQREKSQPDNLPERVGFRTMPVKTWFLFFNGKTNGPITEEAVVQMIRLGAVSPPDALCWKSGWSNWAPMTGIPEFDAQPQPDMAQAERVAEKAMSGPPPPPADCFHQRPAFPGEGAIGQLHCIAGPLRGNTFQIPREGVFLGRDSQLSNIVVPDSRVSGRHAWIGKLGGPVVIRDCGSKNGVFLDDGRAPLKEAMLRGRESITLVAKEIAQFIFVTAGDEDYLTKMFH